MQQGWLACRVRWALTAELDPTRRKWERTRAQVNRDFPYQVEVPIPFGGLRRRLDELNAIARPFDHARSNGTT